MSENVRTPDETSDGDDVAPTPPPPPRRGPGHRGQDVRDTMAEMAAKAHEISLEAGSKMAATMREVIGAAAGLTAFAIESARDLVQYMVRRGQMTSDEADKLMREVEEAHAARVKLAPPPPPAPPPAVAVKAEPVKKVAPPPAPVPVHLEPVSAPKAAKPPESPKAEPAAKPAKKAPPSPPPAAAKKAPPPAKPVKAPAKAPAKAATKKAPAKRK